MGWAGRDQNALACQRAVAKMHLHSGQNIDGLRHTAWPKFTTGHISSVGPDNFYAIGLKLA